MAETPDMLALLQQPMSDFPDLPSLPEKKTFYGKILSVAAGASEQKQTPRYSFELRITDQGKDVTERDLAEMKTAGFSLADYNATAHFYLTPGALKMLRSFMTSLGFPENVSFFENMKLSPEGVPTEATQELFRGRDIMFTTPRKGDNGRVYLGNVENCIGVKQ